ncbi:hypothetical protein ACLMAJ_19200 [Nocardia sp. KC 131]|uniref:hypothetical protein n=1 Tax=Nocardia arseniciresistens TaxID=3392119 RepID=UPI00398F83D2
MAVRDKLKTGTVPDIAKLQAHPPSVIADGVRAAERASSGADQSIAGRMKHSIADTGASKAAKNNDLQTAAERSMQQRRLTTWQKIDDWNKFVFRAQSDNGATNAYKLSNSREMLPILLRWLPARPGVLAKNEVAAYRVDAMLGFGRVPPTAIIHGPEGPGSVQQWVFSTKGLPYNEYPILHQEQMAILDYIIANSDRSQLNYRTDRDGGIVAIDHQLSFPEKPGSDHGIDSDFVKAFVADPSRRFSDEVMRSVNAIDTNELRKSLLDVGLSRKAVQGALDRLSEIRAHGTITGEAWPGKISGTPTYWPDQMSQAQSLDDEWWR